jgi:dCMP deaminase
MLEKKVDVNIGVENIVAAGQASGVVVGDPQLQFNPNRPSWDDYYLATAYVLAQRSMDPSTKCGCVIVSKDNRVLSTGYNGPIKGSKDHLVPLTRPFKYYFMIHSEINALLAYGGSHQDISGATCYVTSRPCHVCLRSLLQKGIGRIVYGAVAQARMLDEQDMKAQEMMLRDHPIEFKEVDVATVRKLFEKLLAGLETSFREEV